MYEQETRTKVLLSFVKTLQLKSMSERILFALSSLLFVFVIPPTFIRLVNQHWGVFFLDLFLVSSAAFIFYNTYKSRYLNFLKIYMCCLVSTGASLTVILGGVEQVYWLYPTTLTAFFLVSQKLAFIFLIAMSIAVGNVVFTSVSGIEAMTIYLSLYGTAGFINAFSHEIMSENESLSSLASLDHLTGAGNRRSYEEKALICQNLLDQKGVPATLIALDIDDFKILNDTHGHITGDNVLQHLCGAIDKRLTRNARLYRIGGEEFAILLPENEQEEGVHFAQMIQFVLSNKNDPLLPPYTVSMGVAQNAKGESIEQWLERADKAMYKSKRNGKNRISAA